MYNDYTKAVNVAHDWVRWPCVRISTAEIPSFLGEGAPLGVWYETWIFSDCPHIGTTQVVHKTRLLSRVLRAHGHIVRNHKGILEKWRS